MFSVYTGLRFEDAQRLTIYNISYENNELSSNSTYSRKNK